MCDMTHSYMCHDSLVCVTWPIHMCNQTRSYVWHDLVVCVTWLTDMCDITPRFKSDKTYRYARKDAQSPYTRYWEVVRVQHLSKTHCSNTRQHTATHWNSLQHTATHCYTLQHMYNTSLNHTHTPPTTYTRVWVTPCVAVCCSVLQGVAHAHKSYNTHVHESRSVLQCVAVCCSVLQCVAVYCSVLQCIAVCCSVLQLLLPCITHWVYTITASLRNGRPKYLYRKKSRPMYLYQNRRYIFKLYIRVIAFVLKR